MKKILLFSATGILLAAKYIEMLGMSLSYNLNLVVTILAILGSLIVIFESIKFLDVKWKSWSVGLSAIGIIAAAVWIPYTYAWMHFIWNFLIFTALFLVFYRMAHYEIKKFPAFSYSFMLIYIMTESISMWRGDTYAPFFLAYLTFILPMYFVGINKIKE